MVRGEIRFKAPLDLRRLNAAIGNCSAVGLIWLLPTTLGGGMTLVWKAYLVTASGRTPLMWLCSRSRARTGVQSHAFNPSLVPAAAQARAVAAAQLDLYRARMRPVLAELHGQGLNLSAIAREMNRRGIKTARGRQWEAQTVKDMLSRLEP